ncbi:uncharacterized protein LOC135335595 [Halichondria panicea]|uniref:uncharacterized protein LOC135335594 n=1 Tax=Halichondria panicea TaxID=6063 RepID=UPI00312B5474
MNANLMLCFAFFVLSALCGAIAAPLPNTESAGELITNTTESIAESYNTTSPTNSTPTTAAAIAQSQLSASGFNCSAPGEGHDFAVAAGYLLEGLYLLDDYSKIVQRSYRNFIDQEHQCSTPEITKAYDIDSSNNNIWNSLAALQGYADLARLASQSANQLQDEPRNQMQGVDDLISAVLSDYKTVLAQQHCECNPSAPCNRVVLTPSIILRPGCKHYPYVARNLYTDVLNAENITDGLNLPTTNTITTNQWVNTRLGIDSPAYTYFQ